VSSGGCTHYTGTNRVRSVSCGASVEGERARPLRDDDGECCGRCGTAAGPHCLASRALCHGSIVTNPPCYTLRISGRIRQELPMTAQPKTSMTVEEYLAFEETSPIKHEYFAGRIVALAGGNEAHAIISSNINALLNTQLRERPCTVYTSDMKVRAEQPRKYLYPDISVVCGQPRYEDTKRRVLLNPTIIVEVLSASTERFDRGVKFQWYRSIASVQEYLLVSQDARYIDHYQRQSDNLWSLSSAGIEDETLYLPSINGTLRLDDIYAKVNFDPEDAAFFDES
jgi:Uma2 family endonuclease